MGCDIHIYAEKKVGDNWICINPLEYRSYDDDYTKRKLIELDVHRNYELFGWLANVRYEIDKGFKAKGLPP